MSMTRITRLRRSLEELFPERHLYVRSGGEMRAYVLTTSKQLVAAAGVGAAALWMGICTAAMMVNGMQMSASDQEIARTQAQYERWIADRQARLNSAVAQLNATNGSIDDLALSVEKRHAALAMLLSDYKTTPGAADALAPEIHKASADLSVTDPVRRIELVRAGQERLLDSADSFAKGRAERLRMAFRLAGLSPNGYAPKSGELGGPLIEAKDPSALAAVLESALETLEAVLMLTPRKQRKAVKTQCERADTMLEELSGVKVARLASCEAGELRVLGEKLGAVQALRAVGETGLGCMNVMEAALDELEKCSDVVVGSSRQLVSTQPTVRRLGLEALAGLPRIVLEESVSAELGAASLVLAVAVDEGKADGERATALMGLFMLGLRNAKATVDVLIKYLSTGFFAEVYDGRVQGREGALMCVHCFACYALIQEIACKYGAAVRGPLEKAYMGFVLALVKGSCPKARYLELLPLWLDATESDERRSGGIGGVCSCNLAAAL